MFENKNSYFEISLLPSTTAVGIEETQKLQAILEDMIEPVLSKMKASSDTFLIRGSNQLKTLKILFKTKERKRLSFLRNALKKNFRLKDEENINYGANQELQFLNYQESVTIGNTEALSQEEFQTRLKLYKSNPNLYIKGEISGYDGDDLSIFNKKENWRKWQVKLYDLLYTDYKLIKEPSDREIIFILDKRGCSGKSKLTKYLITKDPENVTTVSEGTAAQLKSSLLNIGKKKIYLIDLARTPSENGFQGLANALENLKNGMICSNFYGVGNSLMMSPPWIIVFAKKLPESCWSNDRWRVFEITKNYDWEDVSEEYRKKALLIEKALELQEEKEMKKKLQILYETKKEFGTSQGEPSKTASMS